MSWNKDAAVNYARNHAGSASQHRCAHFVSNAVRAGGARLINTNYAKDMAFNLRAAGFRAVYGAPMKGDVAVIQPIAGHPAEHACIYGGDGTWYSDYKQNSMYPGNNWASAAPSYQLFRHN
ncbi:CHAP domain-containing protein [Citrobacter portucalensis]|uniref:CHAP domain-containing protein n=1 Tax=Citrobacter portucalensis TaxID=1639133 RepID=A0ABZ0H682_9ENTR|nr:CHAP domain-containing protein [Citrobacter portucalensis]MBJ9336132.1 CHAP domain-containing protein [Citrobacter freundii]MCE9894345.1 CHAP domain-containing protein [Citrobacter portucalensis]MDE9575343.1 CHAP domain-containing protein [Citrobacter portucalensis]MDE9648927.1 CHAP domain-containing protein [Citrobacter portucalensis]MDE9662851.1 CHAP domain-containing protein [Citrobacter portucalensis]